jgi:hypothetical protein
MRRHTLRPSPAMIVAILALFIALGGTGFAALSRHSVGTKQLKNSAVTSSKIRKHAVTRKKIARNAVDEAAVATDAITGRNVNEATLAEVPRAAVAGSAETVDIYVPFGFVTAEAGEARTLVSYGPFSLIGKCAATSEGTELWASVVFATTEEHTAFAGESAANGDAGPATPEDERVIENPSMTMGPFEAGGAKSAAEPGTSDARDGFEAQAPSGRSWAGVVQSWASRPAGQCRWSGYILKTS